MKGKILVTANLILMLLVITGFSYSHWSDTAKIQGTVKIAHRKLIIDSYKVLTPTGAGYEQYHPILHYRTPDKLTLVIICENVTNDWEIAVGLLIHNNDTLPLKLEETQITVLNNTEEVTIHFNITTWYYGPYSQGTNFNKQEAWNGTQFEQIPPPDNVTTPITLEHCSHAISWTIVEFKPQDPIEKIEIITIEATPISSPDI